jgi:hypothetical protein
MPRPLHLDRVKEHAMHLTAKTSKLTGQIEPSFLGGVATTTVLHPAICAGWTQTATLRQYSHNHLSSAATTQSIFSRENYALLNCFVNAFSVAGWLAKLTTASIRVVDGRTAVPPGT